MRKDISFVSVEPVTLDIDGTGFLITPLTIGELPAVIREVDPLLAQLIYESGSLDAPRLLSLMGEHGDAIVRATALCARVPLEMVQKMLPDRAAALAAVVVEVNSDFFTRATRSLAQTLPGLAPELGKSLAGLGLAALSPA